MREDVARRAYEELEANGYEPRLHKPVEESGLLAGDLQRESGTINRR